jgi:hypothetical protein
MAATVIDALFGDVPLEEWPPDDDAAEFPWSAFVEARRNPEHAVELWQQVARADDVEPRHVAQAWHFLRQRGVRPEPGEAKRVLGLVVELGMKKGVDVLAVYPDRSIRYYNHAGGGVVIDRAEGEQAELVDALLAAAAEVVVRIGPWEEPRLGPPDKKSARMSFLTPSGLHFGQGPTKKLYDDPLGGLVLKGATVLLTEITARGGGYNGPPQAGR